LEPYSNVTPGKRCLQIYIAISCSLAKEAELQGASSVVRGNAVVEGMQGVM
jgi:hypothetical protein